MAVIAAYLTFFPVTINTLRGLTSADPRALELMRSYAGGRLAMLLEAAHACVAAVRLRGAQDLRHRERRRRDHRRAAASVRGGLGDAILNFNQYYSTRARPAVGDEPHRRDARHRVLPRRRARREARRPPRAGERRVNADRPSSRCRASKEFGRGGVVALEGIDLDVRPGEFVSLIGPSGCGKSTLLRIVGDLIQPTARRASSSTARPRTAPALDRDYGIVFQDAVLFDWRTVERNIALPLEMTGWGRERRRERVREMLELVELAGFERHYPWQLSGGMQQRVSIARALSFSPALLLMDEPFGALDEMTRERLNLELLRSGSRRGSTVIFVTHSIAEAVFLSTRVVVMSPRPGRITGHRGHRPPAAARQRDARAGALRGADPRRAPHAATRRRVRGRGGRERRGAAHRRGGGTVSPALRRAGRMGAGRAASSCSASSPGRA